MIYTELCAPLQRREPFASYRRDVTAAKANSRGVGLTCRVLRTVR